MQNIKLTVTLLVALSWLSPAQATTENQLNAIAKMGELNGVALQCSFMEQMQRIKLNLVLHLPKQRELGDWFEQKTSASFMDFMSKDSSCPDSTEFVEQVDAAIMNIETTFKQ
ncbi:MAG: hypothetical protein HOM14_18690 [Gammaproteobacteria bacterium]|jgi:hypothetical protein|nr:hypothetical protein [Gammaproteobacteria bacterium]MBT3724163.1 hypothetical protein [Gammaproteobacteria bacterium]MBT4076926.1 hypothetical protein [Gammaproteobacteria bacterium]MBT4194752.1 hypothetical protein [Gammaproteobacteria bacterium]MBT4450397.1 hypothetical protein [Gammaproteobacteria bacterium]